MPEAIFDFKSIKAIATGLKDYESEVEVKPVTPEPSEGWHVYWQENLYGEKVVPYDDGPAVDWDGTAGDL